MTSIDNALNQFFTEHFAKAKAKSKSVMFDLSTTSGRQFVGNNRIVTILHQQTEITKMSRLHRYIKLSKATWRLS